MNGARRFGVRWEVLVGARTKDNGGTQVPFGDDKTYNLQPVTPRDVYPL
jgi:hypothetical protein